MKKIVLSLLALAATMNIMAVTYSAKATITLESQDSYESCQMIIGESNQLAAGLNNGEYAEINMEGRSVALYVEYGGVKYQHFASAPSTMKNLTLGAMTDAATDYNLIISDVIGAFTLKLGDAEPVVIAAGTTVISLNKNAEYAIGVINYEAAPVYAAEVTTNPQGLATFSFHEKNLVPVEDGVKLYKGSFNGYNATLGLVEVDGVLADKGVIVYGAANTTYHFNEGAVAADFSGDDLQCYMEWEHRNLSNSIYVLSGNALYLYEGNDMKPNKAYLELAPNVSGAPRRISFVFDDATAIDNVEAEAGKAEKFIENGQLFIRRGNEVFNLQGQIVK